MAKSQWKVEVVEIETGDVVRTITCGEGDAGERKADKVERGVLRNLDTERFCVGTVGPELHIRAGDGGKVHAVEYHEREGKARCGTPVSGGTIVTHLVSCERCREGVGHGGARANAGRPIEGGEALTVQYMIRMSERQRERLQEMVDRSDEADSGAALIRDWIDSFAGDA